MSNTRQASSTCSACPASDSRRSDRCYQELGIGSLDELEAGCPRRTPRETEGVRSEDADEDPGRDREGAAARVEVSAADRTRSRGTHARAARENQSDRGCRSHGQRPPPARNHSQRQHRDRNPQQRKVIEALKKSVDKFEEAGENTYRGVLRGEMSVMFHLSHPDNFGTTVVQTTGSQEFVQAFRSCPKQRPRKKYSRRSMCRSWNRSGANRPRTQEKETRQTRSASDLRGTFHVHTTFSDGRNSVLEMLTAAKDRGYDYVGLSDHSPAAFYANG